MKNITPAQREFMFACFTVGTAPALTLRRESPRLDYTEMNGKVCNALCYTHKFVTRNDAGQYLSLTDAGILYMHVQATRAIRRAKRPAPEPRAPKPPPDARLKPRPFWEVTQGNGDVVRYLCSESNLNRVEDYSREILKVERKTLWGIETTDGNRYQWVTAATAEDAATLILAADKRNAERKAKEDAIKAKYEAEQAARHKAWEAEQAKRLAARKAAQEAEDARLAAAVLPLPDMAGEVDE